MKIALRWAEENGWGSCGTDVGKQRANQLAKNFYKLLKNLADEKNPLQLHGATTRDLELSQGIQNSDFAEWME